MSADFRERLNAIVAERAERMATARARRLERTQRKGWTPSKEQREAHRARELGYQRKMDDGRSRLRTARLAAGLGRAELARRSVVSVNTIQRLEADPDYLLKVRRVYLLARLATVLKIDRRELFPEVFQ